MSNPAPRTSIQSENNPMLQQGFPHSEKARKVRKAKCTAPRDNLDLLGAGKKDSASAAVVMVFLKELGVKVRTWKDVSVQVEVVNPAAKPVLHSSRVPNVFVVVGLGVSELK